jgi:2-desacetyl-2-hydroxyethyl bacteriochlorophyllide A dehydrogenase
MEKKMKALTIKEPGKLVIEDIEKPELISDHAVIKMETCGICGSDVTAYAGKNPTMKYPIQGIGHEGVGTIVEIGANEKGLKVGDRVALEPYVPDFTCHMCNIGRYNNCVDLHVRGVHTDGMMVEYFSHPIPLIHKLPDELSAVQAACVEPLTIGLHGATRARVAEGEKVVIFGAGTIGLMAAFSCLSYGATPILVDVLQARLDYAKEVGIPYVFNSMNGDVVEFLKEVTNGKLPDAMVECTGAAPILAEMHDYVCHGGRISLVGWPKGPVTINTIRCMQKEIDICPSRNSANKFPESINLIATGKVPVDKIITKTIELAETEEVIRDMIENPSDYLKVVVRI